MKTQTEIYVACSSRDLQLAVRFLDRFVPRREPAAEDYPFPEFSADPERVFASPEPLMKRLQSLPGADYGIYWNRLGAGDPRQAMLFYTEDGGLIAGVATVGSAPQCRKLMAEMATLLGGDFGYVTEDERPPDSMSAFEERSRQCDSTRLVDGQLIG